MATRPAAARILLAATAAFALLASAHAAHACPQSCIWTPAGPEYCTPAAVLDTSITQDPGGLCSSSREDRFDVPHGTLGSDAASPFGGCTPRTTVHDDFTILGLPDGTSVALTARLDVSAQAGGFLGDGTLGGQITEGASNSAAVQWDIENDFPGQNSTRARTLAVPVAAIAGTPFHMTYQVGSSLGSLCYADIAGTFTFDGLPAGTSIVSCKGFVEAPTPALPASWGSVKARYR